MKEATSLVEIWLNLLTRLPKWNVDKSILYLLNVVARIGWIQYNDVIKSTISTMLNEANVYRPSKGLASRVGVFFSFPVSHLNRSISFFFSFFYLFEKIYFFFLYDGCNRLEVG